MTKNTKTDKPTKSKQRQTNGSGLFLPANRFTDIWGNNKINGGPNVRQYSDDTIFSDAKNKFISHMTNKMKSRPIKQSNKNGCKTCKNYNTGQRRLFGLL
jgi:hypothetical protein